MAHEIKSEIKVGSKAHLTSYNRETVARRVRRPEDSAAVEDAWDVTFGQHCDKCNHKHARHSPCRGGDA